MYSQIELKSVDIYGFKRSQTLLNYPSVLGLSDSAIYTYTREAAFLRPKEERYKLYFFQGLNTNPQNLSIFVMSEATYYQQINPGSKQRITKALFNVYDIYNKRDCVVEISIPGNLKIYKIVNGKKEIVSSEQIDLLYVSSIMRAFYQKNLLWGRYYELFKDPKDNIREFNAFLNIFLRVALKHQIFISEDFQSTAQIKGSHSLTLLLRFVKGKRIHSSCLAFLAVQMQSNPQLSKSAKFNIFMAQLYSQEGKFSKALERTILMARQYSNEPYILFYKAKYLHQLLMIDQALQVLNQIVQFNQFQIWMLLAKIHSQLKNHIESLLCLNNASKISKYKSGKGLEPFWKVFQEIGKPKALTPQDPIFYYTKLNTKCESPLNVPVKNVEQKLVPVLQHPAWKLNKKEGQIYRAFQSIRYKMQADKFQQLVRDTFEQQKGQTNEVAFKKGLSQSMLADSDMDQRTVNQQQKGLSKLGTGRRKKTAQQTELQEQQLPQFLKQDNSMYEASMIHQDARNLSIIPEIESLIQNSAYEQKENQEIAHRKQDRRFHKRQMNEQTFKILKVLFADDEFQRTVFQGNYAKMLPVYNKLRNAYFLNNYFYLQMFEVFVQTGTYNSIVVLLAEYLDFIEGKGMKKMRKLPYWLQNWIFVIIQQKGLAFLKGTLNKLNYIDEAVLQSIENARRWKLAGVSF